MPLKDYNRYFCKIEIFAHGEIDERSLVTPAPGLILQKWDLSMIGGSDQLCNVPWMPPVGSIIWFLLISMEHSHKTMW